MAAAVIGAGVSWPTDIGVRAIDGVDVVQLSAATRITVTGP